MYVHISNYRSIDWWFSSLIKILQCCVYSRNKNTDLHINSLRLRHHNINCVFPKRDQILVKCDFNSIQTPTLWHPSIDHSWRGPQLWSSTKTINPKVMYTRREMSTLQKTWTNRTKLRPEMNARQRVRGLERCVPPWIRRIAIAECACH